MVGMGAPRLHGPGWLPLNDSAGIDMQIGLKWRERDRVMGDEGQFAV